MLLLILLEDFFSLEHFAELAFLYTNVRFIECKDVILLNNSKILVVK